MRTCTKCGVAYDDTGFYGKHPHCRLCQRKAHKEYYERVIKNNPEHRKEVAKKWRNANRERYRANQNRYYAKIRLKALSHYSNGTPKCACCGETEIQFLSFDHINGGGNAQLKEIGSRSIIRWLIKNGYPPGFQILCHNCNFSKGHYGQCPHNLTKGLQNANT